MARTLVDLRSTLFDALDGLTAKEHPMKIQKAKAIADVSQVILNSAKIELEYIKTFGKTGHTNFLTGRISRQRPLSART